MTSNGRGPHGKKGVVLGIANAHSIAYEGFTKSFCGAEKVQ
jgi:enoyl-[acyl-carrier-protein] reductase (NADH)